MYEYDWTIKPSGKVFQDLFYNKWWTKEAGKTDANGEFSVALGECGVISGGAIKPEYQGRITVEYTASIDGGMKKCHIKKY